MTTAFADLKYVHNLWVYGFLTLQTAFSVDHEKIGATNLPFYAFLRFRDTISVFLSGKEN